MKLLIHVEQYDVLGILPSQLESLAHLCTAMGITERAFVDGTPDGIRRAHGFTRYSSLEEWRSAIQSAPVYSFTPDGQDIRKVDWWDPEGWLAFGPSMGWRPTGTTVSIPGGTMNSRDCVPIALWEVSSWQAQ